MKFLPRLQVYDDVFNNLFDGPFFRDSTRSMMKTDISEKDGIYYLDMELPGFKKEDIKMELIKGYLHISAEHESSNEEKDKDGNIIRQERSTGSCSRSFYVGDEIKEEDIKAQFMDGELKITLPNIKKQAEIEEKKIIPIE